MTCKLLIVTLNEAHLKILRVRRCERKCRMHEVVTQQTFVLMKTSWRRFEDVFYLRLQKTSSRRLDQGDNIRFRYKSSEYVFKTSSRRLGQQQNIRLGHTSSRRLQDVFKRSWKDVSKTFSRRVIKLNCSC